METVKALLDAEGPVRKSSHKVNALLRMSRKPWLLVYAILFVTSLIMLLYVFCHVMGSALPLVFMPLSYRLYLFLFIRVRSVVASCDFNMCFTMSVPSHHSL